MDDLIQLVQDLPPELYKAIYELTFSTSFKAVYKIDKDYKPPSVLQVSQSLRQALCPMFYAITIFSFTDHVDSIEHLRRWLTSLTNGQRMKLALPITKSTIQILSERKLATTGRINDNLTISRARLTYGDQKAFLILQDRIDQALSSVPCGFNVRLFLEKAPKFRFESDCGPAVWWDWHLDFSKRIRMPRSLVED